MKSSIVYIATALLLASGNSKAQDTASDTRRLLSLAMVNLQYTTAEQWVKPGKEFFSIWMNENLASTIPDFIWYLVENADSV